MSRPHFKKGNAIIFQNDLKDTDYPINPHEAVQNPTSKYFFINKQNLIKFH